MSQRRVFNKALEGTALRLYFMHGPTAECSHRHAFSVLTLGREDGKEEKRNSWLQSLHLHT